MKKVLLAAIVSLFIASGNANAANLIVNPSFENGNWQGNGSWDRVFAGESNIQGWYVGGYAVDWHNSAEMQNPQDIEYVIDLNTNAGGATGTISQTFKTTIGDAYLLSFYLSNPYPDMNLYSPNAFLNVNIAGNDYNFFESPSSSYAMVWGQKTLTFTANSETTTLTFSSLDDRGYWGPVIDNVSVTPAPEPSSMILGLMGIASTFKLRKRQA